MKVLIWAFSLSGLFFGSEANAESFCSQIAGAAIVARDGKFLGSVSSKYDANSIFNEYGNYGSKYSTDSILNRYSDYGSEYSDSSPFNKFATNPPFLVIDQNVVALLTINDNLHGAVNPYAIFACQ